MPDACQTPQTGAFSRLICWLFGSSWKTSLCGLIGALAKFLPGVAVIQSSVVPYALSNHWNQILAWCLFVGGICTLINGRIAKDQ